MSDPCEPGRFCFGSLLSQVLGIKFDDSCMECFAAAGYNVDNESRPAERTKKERPRDLNLTLGEQQ